MKLLKLAVPLVLVFAASGCGSQTNADADACELFVPAFADLTIVVGDVDNSTSSLIDLKTSLDSSVAEAEQASELAKNKDLKEQLDIYVADGQAASTSLDDLIAGTIDYRLPALMGSVGDTGDWLINHCAG